MRHTHNLTKHNLRLRRVRNRIRGSAQRPRLHVYRSNRFLYGQIINDEKGVTLVSVTEKELTLTKATKTEKATALGALMAQKAKTKKISKVAFDRGGYRYHGRVRTFAESAREKGLDF